MPDVCSCISSCESHQWRGQTAVWTFSTNKDEVTDCEYGRVWKVWTTDPELFLFPVFSFLYLQFEVNHSLLQIFNHLRCLTTKQTTFTTCYKTVGLHTLSDIKHTGISSVPKPSKLPTYTVFPSQTSTWCKGPSVESRIILLSTF